MEASKSPRLLESATHYFSARRAGKAFAEIVHNDEMKSRLSLEVSAWPLFQEYSVEHFGLIQYANFDSRFFQQFTGYTFLQTLSKLQCAARNRPFTEQRFAAAADQQCAALIDNHAPDANYGPI